LFSSFIIEQNRLLFGYFHHPTKGTVVKSENEPIFS